jgi:hypothetical protein
MLQGGPSASSGAVTRAETEILTRTALTGTPQASDPFVVDGYETVHFHVRLRDTGTASISSLVIEFEWCNETSPIASDWSPVYREEFNTPGSGISSLSVYKPTIDAPTVDGGFGYTLKARGKQMRCKVYAGTSPTDVDVFVTAIGG